jgi:hypothetical protein
MGNDWNEDIGNAGEGSSCMVKGSMSNGVRMNEMNRKEIVPVEGTRYVVWR